MTHDLSPSLSVCLSLSLSLSLSPISSPFFGSDRCSMVSLPTSAKVEKKPNRNLILIDLTELFIIIAYFFRFFPSSQQKPWAMVGGAPSLRRKLKNLLLGVAVGVASPTSQRSTVLWRELYTQREWTHPS